MKKKNGARKDRGISRASKKPADRQKITPYSPIDFDSANKLAQQFAQHIQSHFEEIADILLEYESYEVVQDETSRALDLLTHLEENKDFFVLRVGQVTSFLPRNQPLYALTCFVIVPSLMASEVHFRIPHSMRHFFPRLLKTLNVEKFFKNIVVSDKERMKFLRERSALLIDPKTEESIPVTDVVIFTGTSHHAQHLRLVFDQRTLFITNGAGHNPVVVSEDANIQKSVEATLSLQLYNQGQDCAAPNCILVHQHSFDPFIRVLREELRRVKVGHYHDRSCRVGPISDPDDLKRIQGLLVDNREWIDPFTPGIIRTQDSIVEPTIINRPLSAGGNYSEVFSPLIFVQRYNKDSDLSLYFEHPHYAHNAMYISLYGTSSYIESLIGKKIEGKVLHDKNTVLNDTHLHAPGVERGSQPYGGYGHAASSISINGKLISKPTLPQRDIHEQVALPILQGDKIKEKQKNLARMKTLLMKDVQKLLGMKLVQSQNNSKEISAWSYFDMSTVSSQKKRYVNVDHKQLFSLLPHPNKEHIAILEPKQVRNIRSFRKFLGSKKKLNHEEFESFLYSIGSGSPKNGSDSRSEQLSFFKNVYKLLFGRDSGPRLAQFVMDADRVQILNLLDV